MMGKRRKAKSGLTANQFERLVSCRKQQRRRNPVCMGNSVLALINPPKAPLRFSQGAASPVRHLVRDGKVVVSCDDRRLVD